MNISNKTFFLVLFAGVCAILLISIGTIVIFTQQRAPIHVEVIHTVVWTEMVTEAPTQTPLPTQTPAPDPGVKVYMNDVSVALKECEGWLKVLNLGTQTLILDPALYKSSSFQENMTDVTNNLADCSWTLENLEAPIGFENVQTMIAMAGSELYEYSSDIHLGFQTQDETYMNYATIHFSNYVEYLRQGLNLIDLDQ